MGVCASTTKVKADNPAANSAIEKMLEQDKKATRSVVKLLLLGPGESGKSTILKQMRILHTSGFTEEEISQRKAAVYSNTVQSMAAILNGLDTIGSGVSEELKEDALLVHKVIQAEADNEPISAGLYQSLKKLWSDANIQRAYEQRTSEFQVIDSAKYFLDSLDRVYDKDFEPSTQDILMTRVATIGVSSIEFHLEGLDFKVFDVGGQKSERRKWIHCFDDVNAIIFIVAASEYDKMLREDGITNRMHDSLSLFDEICNSPWFVAASMILFLNKRDLLAEKIKTVPLTVCFPEYTGPQRSYNAAIDYLIDKFDTANRNVKKQIYTHETCATDTDQVQLVLESVIDMLIAENMQGVGVA